MQILWLATKAPWPPSDGGRLVATTTIDSLIAAGAHVTVLAPAHPPHAPHESATTAPPPGAPAWWTPPVVSRPAARARTVFDVACRGASLQVARHRHPALVDAVADHVASRAVDVVHVEQLQAWTSAAPAVRAGLPVVLRAQNVESATWRGDGVRGALARFDARRLADHEARVARAAAAVIALSADDAAAFRGLAPSARVVEVAAPMPAWLPSAQAALTGRPACAWVGSAGWGLNDDALAWLLRDVWRAIVAETPEARLHVFGRPACGDGRTVIGYPSPRDSGAAFDAEGILLLPLRHGAGVRMRILEAWARGVPVVATRAAAHGLAVRDGVNALVADTPHAIAAAVRTLATRLDLRRALVDGGRATLVSHHAPASVAAQLLEVYSAAIRALPTHSAPRII